MKTIWNSKRWLAMLLALMMALCLTACGGSSPAPAADNTGSTGSEGGTSAGSSTENVSNETYRTIQVYQMDGTVEVQRNGKTMAAYVNMMLENGDQVTTKADSHLYARLDEDKYLLVEPDSVFTLEASGTAQNSKTRIILAAGAVVNRITQPLSEGSSYEVSTPNSTMAVRGTGFRVAVFFDTQGTFRTTTQVVQGEVAVYTQDYGDISFEFYLVKPNEKAEVQGDTENSNIVGEGAQEMTAEETIALDEKTQEFLEAKVEELAKIAEENLAQAQEGEGQGGETQENQPPAQQSQGTTPPPTPPENEDNGTSIVIDNHGGGSGDGGSSGGSTPPAVTNYTVTFRYDGKVFGTQTVEAGKTAQMPTLQPTAHGEWCAVDAGGQAGDPFDFSKAIQENTVVLWMDIPG